MAQIEVNPQISRCDPHPFVRRGSPLIVDHIIDGWRSKMGNFSANFFSPYRPNAIIIIRLLRFIYIMSVKSPLFRGEAGPSSARPMHKTRVPKPLSRKTRNRPCHPRFADPKPQTRNPSPETRLRPLVSQTAPTTRVKPETRNQKPGTSNRKPSFAPLFRRPLEPNPRPQTPDPRPQTLNPKPCSPECNALD